MNVIDLNKDQFLELEKIASGAFHPLDGFMGENDFNTVVESMRLVSGEVFPIPIVLDIDRDTKNLIENSQSVFLAYENQVIGKLYPSSFFECDRQKVVKKVYGTDSLDHPGVKNFCLLKSIFVGGKIELFSSIKFDFSNYEITPTQAKKIFLERGWQKIVGFQTRNIPHRAHEYLLRIALETADGLFIQPLVGKKKTGDFTPEAIICGYKALLKDFLPEKRVLLGVLSTQMRYAGPREAIFHALVRRNYGCTHFIVGRDHAGVGDWYGLYDAHDLIDQVREDLGIEIIKLKGPYYCTICDGIVTQNTCIHENTKFAHQISGTDIRKILSGGEIPDRRFMRPEVVFSLRKIKYFIE